MRIAYVTPELIDPNTLKPYDGGLATYLCKISQAMVRRGHDVRVFVMDAACNRTIMWNGVEVIFVCGKLRKTFVQRLLWPFFSRRHKRHLKRDCARRYLFERVRMENARKQIDIIQYASWRATGKFPEPDIPSCVRISSYAKLWQKYYGYVSAEEVEDEIVQFRAARFLYGPSRSIAQYISEDLKLGRTIEIIETPFVPYAGDEDGQLLTELKDKIGGDPYLIFFGSVGSLKGAEEIAASVHELLRRHPKLWLVLVGKDLSIDETSSVSKIKNAAAEFAARVVWYDRQTHARLIPLVRASKGVLLPSRVDNLPNACIEAMGLSKVVIGSRGASFEQLIDDGVSGLLCRAGDADSILEAVDRMMVMTDVEMTEMGAKAFVRSQTLSLDFIVPQVEKYYQGVIEKWEEHK